MTIRERAVLFVCVLAVVSSPGTAPGQPKGPQPWWPVQPTPLPFVHPLFTDDMVLQRDVPAPVWGWSTPGRHHHRLRGRQALGQGGRRRQGRQVDDEDRPLPRRRAAHAHRRRVEAEGHTQERPVRRRLALLGPVEHELAGPALDERRGGGQERELPGDPLLHRQLLPVAGADEAAAAGALGGVQAGVRQELQRRRLLLRAGDPPDAEGPRRHPPQLGRGHLRRGLGQRAGPAQAHAGRLQEGTRADERSRRRGGRALRLLRGTGEMDRGRRSAQCPPEVHLRPRPQDRRLARHAPSPSRGRKPGCPTSTAWSGSAARSTCRRSGPART